MGGLRTPLCRTKAPTKISTIDAKKTIVATIRIGLNAYMSPQYVSSELSMQRDLKKALPISVV